MRQLKCECGTCKYCIKRREYLKHRDAYILRSTVYQKNNKEYVNRKNSKWKKDNRDKVNKSNVRRRSNQTQEVRSIKYRRNDLQQNYGVTPEWWDSKFKEQGGGCGICGVKENNAKNRRMHVDHCHMTNFHRGLLCHRCNTALERIENVENWADRALQYIQKYESAYWEKMNAKYKKV